MATMFEKNKLIDYFLLVVHLRTTHDHPRHQPCICNLHLYKTPIQIPDPDMFQEPSFEIVAMDPQIYVLFRTTLFRHQEYQQFFILVQCYYFNICENLWYS